MTGENLSSTLLDIRHIIYWSVHLSSRRVRDVIKGVDNIILASYKFHFIRVQENLV